MEKSYDEKIDEITLYIDELKNIVCEQAKLIKSIALAIQEDRGAINELGEVSAFIVTQQNEITEFLSNEKSSKKSSILNKTHVKNDDLIN